MTTAFVIPSGNGKTFLATKYPDYFVDIDKLHDRKEGEDTFFTLLSSASNLPKEELLILYNDVTRREEMLNGIDWKKYNQNEVNLIKPKLVGEKRCILLHSKEKADLLNLEVLDTCKVKRDLVEGTLDNRRRNNHGSHCSIHNWLSTEGRTFDSYHDLEQHVVNLYRQKNKIHYV